MNFDSFDGFDSFDNFNGQVQLVEVKAEILPQIQVIDRTCLGGLWSLEAYQREIDSPSSYLLAAIASEVVLGFACLWSILEEAHITILAVRPELQRLGLGRYLVWGLLQEARARGLEWATLEVRASNQAALRLYESFGFVTIGHRRGYYQATGEDAVIMWRKGLQEPDFSQLLQTWEAQIQQRLSPRLTKISHCGN